MAADIGSGMRDMAVNRLRADVQRVIANMSLPAEPGTFCPGHANQQEATKLSLQIGMCIFDAVTTKSNLAVFGATIGTALGGSMGAAIAVYMAVSKVLQGG